MKCQGSHFVKDCSSRITIKKCQRKHHTALHDNNIQARKRTSQSISQNQFSPQQQPTQTRNKNSSIWKQHRSFQPTKHFCCGSSQSVQLNHRHSTQFVNNINIFKTSIFRYYPTTQLQCCLVKTTSTSSHQNSSSKGITTHLEPFKQCLDGPSPDLINQHRRTSRFAPQFLTPPRHPIINSTNFSQVFGKPKTMSLRPKSPCLKKNDTLCQRHRKQQDSRMADTKSVCSDTPMPP